MEEQTTESKPLGSIDEFNQVENTEEPSTSGITEKREIDLRKEKLMNY